MINTLPFQLTWVLLSFWMGALPLSLWVTRLLAGKDPRAVGDHNPGATNALKAGGWRVGLAALMLDVSKGAFPVGMAAFVFNWDTSILFLVAIAPLFGSAFSPFLGFKGGKSLAVSLGIWIGLTLWQVPLVILPVLTAAFLVVNNAGVAVLTTLLVLGVYILTIDRDTTHFMVYVLQFSVLLAKHLEDLNKPLELRGWLRRLIKIQK